MPIATGWRCPERCTAMPRRAPIGSATPLAAAHPIAFHLLPVAKKMGTPSAMPSAWVVSRQAGKRSDLHCAIPGGMRT